MTQTTTPEAPLLVSSTWLVGNLKKENLVIIDLRYREKGSGYEAYKEAHIPGAHFLDWMTDIVDETHPVAFMLAQPTKFKAAMESRGIGDDTHIVAYADNEGSGPHRLWWACRVYGNYNVSVLDGGLEKWKENGFPLTTIIPTPVTSPAPTWTDKSQICGSNGIATQKEILEAGSAPPGQIIVLDSRPHNQWLGEAVWFETGPIPTGPNGVALTPRGAVRAGHIPWSLSFPAGTLYNSDLTFKSPEELTQLFKQVGVDPTKKVVTHCQVGLSASALAFALAMAGVKDVTNYDAGFDEWARDSTKPVATSDQKNSSCKNVTINNNQ